MNIYGIAYYTISYITLLVFFSQSHRVHKIRRKEVT